MTFDGPQEAVPRGEPNHTTAEQGNVGKIEMAGELCGMFLKTIM